MPSSSRIRSVQFVAPFYSNSTWLENENVLCAEDSADVTSIGSQLCSMGARQRRENLLGQRRCRSLDL